MICYGYGISTNVLGILFNRGGYDGSPVSLIVPILFGVLLEVFPEPLLAWAVSGDVNSDPLGKFLDGLVEEAHSSKSNNQNNQQKKHIQINPQTTSKSAYVAQHKPVYQPVQRPVPHAQAQPPYPRESAYLKMLEGDEGN